MPRAIRFGLRVILALGAILWGWTILSIFRTQQFGFSPSILGAAALFVAPAVVIPFLGLRLRLLACGTAALFALVLAAAEVPAALEEARFVRAHQGLDRSGPAVVEDRAWPFSNHYLYYDPAAGKWGAGD